MLKQISCICLVVLSFVFEFSLFPTMYIYTNIETFQCTGMLVVFQGSTDADTSPVGRGLVGQSTDCPGRVSCCLFSYLCLPQTTPK